MSCQTPNEAQHQAPRRPTAEARLPRAGMLARVRSRRGIIASVEPFDAGAGATLHAVRVEYTDADRVADDALLCEREHNAALAPPSALPLAMATFAMTGPGRDALRARLGHRALTPPDPGAAQWLFAQGCCDAPATGRTTPVQQRRAERGRISPTRRRPRAWSVRRSARSAFGEPLGAQRRRVSRRHPPSSFCRYEVSASNSRTHCADAALGTHAKNWSRRAII